MKFEQQQNKQNFFLILDGNNEEKNSADTSNMPLQSKKIKNGDVAIDECKESFGQITQQTGGYTSYLNHIKCAYFTSYVKQMWDQSDCDEYHYVFECSALLSIWKKLFNEYLLRNPSTIKVISLMSTSNPVTLRKIWKLISKLLSWSVLLGKHLGMYFLRP